MLKKWLDKKIAKYNIKRIDTLVNRNELNSQKQKKRVFNKSNNLAQTQIENPNTIPIIIINFNQLYYLKQLINFLIDRDTKNIIIIDNSSTYQPLLSYYEEIKDIINIKIEYQKENLGHLVFWKNRKLFKKYSKGFFVITDADIVPNKNLKTNYLTIMIDFLKKYPDFTKIGFALDTSNLPESYSLKNKVISWEKKFWEKELQENTYDADIDTTFALYWPKTDRIIDALYPSFFNAIRLGGDFVAQHGGWFIDHKNLTDEQNFYFQTSNNSNSWKIDEDGILKGNFKDDY